jgi:hypothetical protein
MGKTLRAGGRKSRSRTPDGTYTVNLDCHVFCAHLRNGKCGWRVATGRKRAFAFHLPPATGTRHCGWAALPRLRQEVKHELNPPEADSRVGIERSESLDA